MRVTIAALIAGAMLMLGAPPASAGSWQSYFPTATMGGCSQCPIGQASGDNNWTNNRVYCPIGYPFTLGYHNETTGNTHFSAPNSSDNPFYDPAYGYSYIFCEDDSDYHTVIYPVTCQGYA
jgi:hypothetical protein